MSLEEIPVCENNEKDELESIVWESMDVLGGSASKGAILKLVSVVTDTKVMKLIDNVDEAVNNLIEKGLVSKQNRRYQIVNNEG